MRPAEGSPESTEQLRRKDVAIRERDILIAGGELGKYRVNHSLFEVVRVGDGVSSEKAVRIGDVIIRADLAVIFALRFRVGPRKASHSPAQVFAVRSRPESQIRLDGGSDRGHQSSILPGRRRRDGIQFRSSARLAQPFVRPKVKELVAPHRAAERKTEIIAAERRLGVSVRLIPSVERAVAEKMED